MGATVHERMDRKTGDTPAALARGASVAATPTTMLGLTATPPLDTGGGMVPLVYKCTILPCSSGMSTNLTKESSYFQKVRIGTAFLIM